MMKVAAFFPVVLALLRLSFAIDFLSSRHRELSLVQARGNISNITLPAGNNYDAPSIGYAEYISSGYAMGLHVTTWPTRRALWHLDEGYLHTIPYCFVDKRSFDLIGDSGNLCKIRQAMNIWTTALNGGADAISGHSFGFRAPPPGTFCCTNYHYGAENQPRTDTDMQCDWDHSKWPSDTLAIHWIDAVKSNGVDNSASVGYVRAADVDQLPGRHFMQISSGASPDTIAHELGHVLGLAHEHQRWDRDDHVEYRCDNLAGMSDIINRVRVAEKMNYEQASKALCEDLKMAEKYYAPSVNFIKGDGLDPVAKPKFDGDGGFDMDSIMIYDSYSFSTAGRAADTKTAVLVAIEKDADGRKIPGSERMIPRNRKPSPRDVEFVKKFYPWDQAEYDEFMRQHPGGRSG